MDHTCELEFSKKSYWNAAPFISRLQPALEKAISEHDAPRCRRIFYVLARYYARTLAIVQSALSRNQEPLLVAALDNLLHLHLPLSRLRDLAPKAVPLVLPLTETLRDRVREDLVIDLFSELNGSASPERLLSAFLERHLLAEPDASSLNRVLDRLEKEGFVQHTGDRYHRTSRPYTTLNLDREILRALVGEELHAYFAAQGFHGVASIASRPESFIAFFNSLTSLTCLAGPKFVEVARLFTDCSPQKTDLSRWYHLDLVGSDTPRDYQVRAYSMFREMGFQGAVIEAPTGSGKTLIGSMCIQDWLNMLASGEKILVLVPTVNYQQQWAYELCFSPIGLRLSREQVFAGPPGQLEREERFAGESPAIVISTYTAMVRLGHSDRDGVDVPVLEKFLQGANIQFVLLDEVHKIVERRRSSSLAMTSVLTDWLADSSLRGLIGFSGTVAPYQARLQDLGLTVVDRAPLPELISRGFVAPFAGFGVPFAYTRREKRVRDLLEEYKRVVRNFLNLVGHGFLRVRFAALPMEDRIAVGTDLLGMYRGRPDRESLARERFEKWEKGTGRIGPAMAGLVVMVQALNGWSDRDLVRVAAPSGAKEKTLLRLDGLLDAARALRAEIGPVCGDPDLERVLQLEGFGTSCLSVESDCGTGSAKERMQRYQDDSALTMVGLFLSLRKLLFSMGEGRVRTVRAILAAEREARPVTGAIIFDRGRKLSAHRQESRPGYRGVAGVFAELRGDGWAVPMAVLSDIMYLPLRERNPITEQVAEFIRTRIMRRELADLFVTTLGQRVMLSEFEIADLKRWFSFILGFYAGSLDDLGAPRPGEFEDTVLRYMRRKVQGWSVSPVQNIVLQRLDLDYRPVRKLMQRFFQYGLTAVDFLGAEPSTLRRMNGRLEQYVAVRLGSGERKQYFYELAARILDDPDLPVNTAVVSRWARTGWNVLTPNVLIDATATRDLTAWQQLRGRAMRPQPGKVAHMYELLKGYGSGVQVIHREDGTWGRTPAIAEKHDREFGVNPVTGMYGSGEEHVPLVGSGNSELGSPGRLKRELVAVLEAADDKVRQGWDAQAKREREAEEVE